MTTDELIAYYADLLILQYLGQSKAYATIVTLVTPVIMDQLPVAVQNAFEIGTAEGVQLDVLGKYAGVTRSGNGFTGPITLNDADFTSLIKVAIIKNNSGSSLYDIQLLLNQFFPGQLFVFDGADMQISYFMSSMVGSQDLAQLFVTEGILPKPMGVELASLIYLPIVTGLFGFRTYESDGGPNISPFNTYADYQMDRPWLSYKDTIQI